MSGKHNTHREFERREKGALGLPKVRAKFRQGRLEWCLRGECYRHLSRPILSTWGNLESERGADGFS
ncbi:hypothetical protein CEXT_747001 [Caerostris extrusa]|uniref:Uncharacterized protein n=1 Tax=Caerostris extrusa TaxID=172846 RepID=A0AAV4M535_CAEEX|nr:hypothetical protein CEXT_747001 [Caerostris extrusa]